MEEGVLEAEEQRAIQGPHHQWWGHAPVELHKTLSVELSHRLENRGVVDLLTEDSFVDGEDDEGGEQAGGPSVQVAVETSQGVPVALFILFMVRASSHPRADLETESQVISLSGRPY